jgi:hypothetical protein
VQFFAWVVLDAWHHYLTVLLWLAHLVAVAIPAPPQAPRPKRKYTRRKDPAEVSAIRKAITHKLVEYEGEMIPVNEKARRMSGECLPEYVQLICATVAQISAGVQALWTGSSVFQTGDVSKHHDVVPDHG